MSLLTAQAPNSEPVRQFSVFTANRLGRLHDLISLLNSRSIHVLALTVLDTTDSAIIRIVVDSPDEAREVLVANDFAFTESELLVIEIDSETRLKEALFALLQAEINIHYTYSLITRPNDKALIAFNLEDHEIAAESLKRHQFQVLRQADLSR